MALDTGYAAIQRYQQLQRYKDMKINVAFILKRLCLRKASVKRASEKANTDVGRVDAHMSVAGAHAIIPARTDGQAKQF